MSKSKVKIVYHCQVCGAEVPQYLGRCPECHSWNSLEEKTITSAKMPLQSESGRRFSFLSDEVVPQILKDIQLTDDLNRYSSGFPELDRVLGGGLIPGAYILFGGDPGIGKSTLMLQVAQHLAHQQKVVLYAAGEESPHQIKMRAERLGLTGESILVFPETNIDKVIEEIKTTRPDVAIIDSVQSLYDPNLSGTPGSVSQIKECAGQLMGIAKALQVTILLVGHVTKDGMVSGPKLLEHTVDGVLYLEGEKFQNLRILRAVKNRFGNTNEIGIFEMSALGLKEVLNPSELFLSESSYANQPGSVIVSTLEGNRPFLVEVQALVGLTTYPSPRRVANGIDIGRLHQIIAVLERRLGLDFSKQDIYINVVGGIRIQEPAADLGIALAIVSSHYEVPILSKTVITGEIGLTGEIRAVSQSEVRMAEGEKLGFERIIMPKVQAGKASHKSHRIQSVEVRSLMEALSCSLDPKVPLSQDKRIQSLDEKENVG